MMKCPTALFVYGTLRHDRPEHARYCRGLVRWEVARVRGQLYRLVEGYDMLVVASACVPLCASTDAREDEQRRISLGPEALAQAIVGAQGDWVWGELLHLADAGEAWPTLDGWEGAVPGGVSTYARLVVPVHTCSACDWANESFAWVYANTQPPVGARAIEVGR